MSVLRSRVATSRAAGAVLPSRMRWCWPGGGADGLTATGRWPLALSGATPRAPGRFGDATRIEEATANLVTNPSFEVDTAGWGTSGTNTIERSTTQAKSGAASLKCTYQDHAFLGWYTLTLTAAQHTLSFWAWVPAAYDGTAPALTRSGFTGATGESSKLLDLTLRDQWQRVDITMTPDAGDLTGFLNLEETGTAPAAGRFIYIDGAQVEQQGYATSYCDGSLGTGYTWQGAAHASASDRAAGRVQVVAALLDEVRGAAAAWLRPSWAGADGRVHYVLARFADANNQLLFYKSGANDWRTRIISDGTDDQATAAATHAAGDDVFVVFNWDARTLGVSLNGGALVEAARAGSPPDLGAAALLDVGRPQDAAGSYANAALGPVLLFDRPLTQAEIDVLAALDRRPGWREVA